jgi:hypothetical protein
MKKGPTPVRGLLHPDLLQRLCRELDETSRLGLLWSSLLPAPLSEKTRPSRYESGRLTVSAPSAAWASRLRQQQASLVQRLRRAPGLGGLRELVVQITPRGESDGVAELRALATSTRRAPVPPGPRTAGLLQEVAARVADPELRASLERLARTLGQGRR